MKALTLFFMLLANSAYAQINLHLERVPLAEFVSLVYGEISRNPYVMSPEIHDAQQPVTVYLLNEKPERIREHADILLERAGFEVVIRSGVAWISKRKEIEKEPDDIVVYRPLYRSASYLADVVQPLTGAKSLMTRLLPQVQQQQQSQGQQQNAVAVKRTEESPSSVAGMTSRGEVDQIAFSVPRKDAVRLQKLLSDLDTPAGEVLLKAAVYEVGTSRADGNALKLALSLTGIHGTIGGDVSGDASVKIKVGDLEGVLTALDRDSRFKSVSRPRVRVRNGAQARFSVGQDVPIIGAQQLDRNGNPVQSVEYKASGIILTARPEIREQVIELDMQQELSSFVPTNTGVNNSPTLIKRSVSTKLSMQPGEVVILAGLQDSRQDAQESRIPVIGWLMGEQANDQQSEILVFIEAQRL